jgi:hypothetical protein
MQLTSTSLIRTRATIDSSQSTQRNIRTVYTFQISFGYCLELLCPILPYRGLRVTGDGLSGDLTGACEAELLHALVR